MKKYIIGGLKFRYIKDISDYSKEIINKLSNNIKRTEEERNFMYDLVKYHPNKSFNIDTASLSFENGKLIQNYIDGSKRPVSIQACIKNIPVIATEFTFGFGKYIGLTIPEVYKLDEGYLNWMISGKVNIYPEVQKKINEFFILINKINTLTYPQFLDRELKSAIEEERYEDASEIRDELNKFKKN